MPPRPVPEPTSPGDSAFASLTESLATAFGAATPGRIGVALSGGGDSVALLLLMARWAAPRGVNLSAATVDHRLRPESAAEAMRAGALCARLGIAHAVLRWEDRDGRGNLQDAARDARRRLLAGWAAGSGIGHVVLGHTRDDQAETVLMRLARGSGVEGLAGMAPARKALGLVWLRPLLAVDRARLRAFLRSEATGWDEDPSNSDLRFDRVRARRALAALADLGIDAAGLAATAQAMEFARIALAHAARGLAAKMTIDAAGDLRIGRGHWLAAPADTRERLAAHLLRALSGAVHRPRRAGLRNLLDMVSRGGSGTLHGCVVVAENGPQGPCLRFGREWQAVRDLASAPGETWDQRWRVLPAEGLEPGGLRVSALGPQGLAQCPGWPATGLSRAGLMATPALWRGHDLVAAPLARPEDPAHALLLTDAGELAEALLH